MNGFLVFFALAGLCAAEPQILAGLAGVSASQYRYQDELGQHAFGHVGGPNSREEVKTADGITRGSYSYVDAHGLIQSAAYVADGAGFRVAATNLPVGPAVPAGPAVAAPAAVVASAPAVVAARLAAPIAAHSLLPTVHALKKRDLVAVSHLTSYPGSTAPLVHHVAAPVVATRLAAPLALHHPLVASPAIHYLKKRSILASPYALAAPLAIHAGALSVPADEPIVAHAKAAQLIQQNTEGLRNNLGGIPLALPADTPAVAAGKIAHSIAHANEAARNAYAHPILGYHGYHGLLY